MRGKLHPFRRGAALAVAAALTGALLAVPAAAVSGWEQHPFSSKAASMQEIQGFLDALNGEGTVNMQVSQTVQANVLTSKRRTPDIPATQIDKSYYERMASLAKGLKLQGTYQGTLPQGSETDQKFLAVTTLKSTVSLCPAGNVLLVEGSLGEGRFTIDASAGEALAAALRELPGVLEAEYAATRAARLSEASSYFSRSLDAAGELIGYGDRLVAPGKDNPEALAVELGDIDTVQIYDGDEVVARVTERADRVRLCNLINAMEPKKQLEREKLGEATPYDGLRLEFRLRDGSKHEYSMSRDASNLVADGKLYNDPKVTGVFTAVLAQAYLKYPARVAWLGYMNARRITNVTVFTGAGTDTYTAASSPSKVAKIAADLKGIRVCGCTPYTRGKLPQAVKGRNPTTSYTLVFDGGAVYNVAEYGEEYLSMEWVGQDALYLYRLA